MVLKQGMLDEVIKVTSITERVDAEKRKLNCLVRKLKLKLLILKKKFV